MAKIFSGKTTTEALSWERHHRQQNLGSVKQHSIFTLLFFSSFNPTSNLNIPIAGGYAEYAARCYAKLREPRGHVSRPVSVNCLGAWLPGPSWVPEPAWVPESTRRICSWSSTSEPLQRGLSSLDWDDCAAQTMLQWVVQMRKRICANQAIAPLCIFSSATATQLVSKLCQ